MCVRERETKKTITFISKFIIIIKNNNKKKLCSINQQQEQDYYQFNYCVEKIFFKQPKENKHDIFKQKKIRFL